jgi:N-acetyl-anhydromuramyl-L-alanine amidase AmpD
MTFCHYLPPVAVHPDRHGTRRPMPPRWIVVHTSEQSYETATAAKDLADYMTRPGDRPSSSGGMYGSSYHDVIDLALTVRPAVPADVVAYSAPGANTEGLHVCMPARSGQDRTDWHDPYSRAQIDTLAGYILDQSARHGIAAYGPLTIAELRAGVPGYTDHYRIGLAFNRTNHTDVGPSFPWDTLTAAIEHHRHQPPEEDMPLLAYYVTPPPGYPQGSPEFVVIDASVRYRNNEDKDGILPSRQLPPQQYDDLRKAHGL